MGQFGVLKQLKLHSHWKLQISSFLKKNWKRVTCAPLDHITSDALRTVKRPIYLMKQMLKPNTLKISRFLVTWTKVSAILKFQLHKLKVKKIDKSWNKKQKAKSPLLSKTSEKERKRKKLWIFYHKRHYIKMRNFKQGKHVNLFVPKF